jgi:hypothetical protein
VTDVAAVDGDLAVLGLIEAEKELGERALARAGREGPVRTVSLPGFSARLRLR